MPHDHRPQDLVDLLVGWLIDTSVATEMTRQICGISPSIALSLVVLDAWWRVLTKFFAFRSVHDVSKILGRTFSICALSYGQPSTRR